MLDIIKEICIFMIIAQAILYFVPGTSYMKYVRLLAGMMIIMKIVEPVFGLLVDEQQKQEIKNRVDALEQAINEGSMEVEIEDNYVNIYEGIEEELKSRLKDCGGRYEIDSVDLYGGTSQTGGEARVVITLSEKGEEGQGMIRIEPITLGGEHERKPEDEEKLKEQYGKCIGVDAGRIELRVK